VAAAMERSGRELRNVQRRSRKQRAESTRFGNEGGWKRLLSFISLLQPKHETQLLYILFNIWKLLACNVVVMPKYRTLLKILSIESSKAELSPSALANQHHLLFSHTHTLTHTHIHTEQR